MATRRRIGPIARDDVPRGSIHDVFLESAALGRPTTTSVYLPAGYSADPMQRCPLVIVHDGPDYLRFAAASTVVDNLIHGGVLPPVVVAFVHAAERLVEYADDVRHHEYLTKELLPHLESELSAGGEPAKRCLVGASFGAVASLSAAAHAPGTFGRLLLQSGSFAGAGVGCWPRPEALWRPIKRFVHSYLANPSIVAERIYVTLRRVRVADLREPWDRASAREHRDGRDIRRVARRPQLGELAGPARGCPARPAGHPSVYERSPIGG